MTKLLIVTEIHTAVERGYFVRLAQDNNHDVFVVEGPQRQYIYRPQEQSDAMDGFTIALALMQNQGLVRFDMTEEEPYG